MSEWCLYVSVFCDTIYPSVECDSLTGQPGGVELQSYTCGECVFV